ncbi:unnamed protein product [Paramecium octaurelia]|uniref:WD domain, G-beta repeat protein n=1 Tax=Paramecium octaurelia TaxID=43137 RepID=A0A8S1TYX0_PAROT|nr:unnamed protein product [Paramecium octaurelia]
MQTVSEQIQRKEYQRKVNKCIENLQLSVESFNNIEAQLDQLLNDESNQIIASKRQCDLTNVNQSCNFKLKDDHFPQEICQEVTSLIKTNIQHIEQQYQQQLYETYSQLQLIIQQKDSQIQQLINSQFIQRSSTFTFTQLNLKPFNYQLIQEYSIKQYQFCSAIAVNKDCSILIAVCESQIKVFEFNSGMLKQTQILSGHTHHINTLNFMKKSDQLISGSQDYSIIIWTKDQNNSWICKQKIVGHTKSIICLVLNNNEDLIVSGSQDGKIKFWQKQNEWLCFQTISEHYSDVFGLSFNEQQNKLISCGRDELILVMEQLQLNKQWIVIQKIKVDSYGKKLCFIDDNTFTFQPYNKDQLHIFGMDSTNKQYTQMKDILVKGGEDIWLFPQQYIKSKCILVNRKASNVSLIRKKQNSEFIAEQFIDFGTNHIYGCLTDDGQFLITWDDKSREYQIRKYQEK